MNKKLTAIGLSAGLLAGTGAGYILQNAGSAGAANAPAAVVTTVPDASNGSTTPPAAPPMADGADHLATVLAPLVADGTITQAQADKVIAALQAAHADMPGGMGEGGRGHRGPGGPGMGGDVIATVADTIGISAADLQAGIADGKTVAEIATANGATAQQVIDALVAQLKEHFDAEVASGEHTQADADQRIADFTTKITQFVNDTQNAPLGGPGMGGRGHHDGDHDGDMGGDTGGSTSGGTIDGGPTDTAAGSDA